MANIASDDRTAERRTQDEQIASEPQMPPLALPAIACHSPIEAHLNKARSLSSIDTALIGRAKELEVAGRLIRHGIYVFSPLVDTGTDLIAANRDASICMPVQVKYQAKGPALNLHESDMLRFEKPNTVIAFVHGETCWFLPFDQWESHSKNKNRRDHIIYVFIKENSEWLAQFEEDRGIRTVFERLLNEVAVGLGPGGNGGPGTRRFRKDRIVRSSPKFRPDMKNRRGV